MSSKKTFTLNDLELDQVVEIRDGSWFIVCKTKEGVVLSGEHGWINPYELYTDDLTDVDGDYEYDVMKVWDVTEDGRKAHAVSPENRELIWEREEDDEHTDEEADIKLLKKLTDDFMTDLGRAFGMSDEEIEATKKEAKEASDRVVAERKKSGVKVNVDVDAEIEDMLKDLDDMLSIASAMTRLNEKYGK